MTVPSPIDLGLPEQFEAWRPAQVEALQWLQSRQKRVKVLSAPTGFGKSPVVVADAFQSGEATAIVTDSRSLQDQYMAQFESVGMVDLRGRNNYVCALRDDPDYTCEDGYAGGCTFKGSINCPASAAEMRAASSLLVVTNYAKWTAMRRYGRGLGHIQKVVFDEGHEAPNALGRAMQVVLNDRERERHIAMDPPSDPDDLLSWKLWALEARGYVEDKLARAQAAIQGLATPPSGGVKHYLHMRALYRRLGVLATCNPHHWVVEGFDGGFIFDPVRPGKYTEANLFFKTPSIVIVSATIRPKTLFLLGQGADTFDYREFDSEFDPKHNPIYWVPTMRVDSRAGDLSRLWNRLDQVAARRRDRKGIVHTISYLRQSEVAATSRFRESMFLNERGDAPTEMIDAYLAGPDGSMLVSPSVGQGHDFPGTACEWQFVCKVPFPPPSKVLKARTEDDKEYPYYLALQKLVQIFGRGCRYGNRHTPALPHDQCENFIADDHVEWMLNRYRHLAPKSFHMFFRRMDVLPAPPERLPR